MPRVNPQTAEINRLKAEIRALAEQLKTRGQIPVKTYNHVKGRLTDKARRAVLHKYVRPLRELADDAAERVKNKAELLSYSKRLSNIEFTVWKETDKSEVRMSRQKYQYRGGERNREKHAHQYFTVDHDGEPLYYIANDRYVQVVIPTGLIDRWPKTPTDIYEGSVMLRTRDRIDLSREFNGEDFLEAMVRANPKASAFANDLNELRQNYKVQLTIESSHQYRLQQNLQLPDPSRVPLREGDARMYSKRIKYPIGSLNSLGELFAAPVHYRPNSCLANAIMNAFADKYNTPVRVKKLSYESIAKLAGVQGYDAADELPLSFEQCIPVFRMLRVKAYQYAPNNKCEGSYNPEDENLSVNRSIGSHNFSYFRKDNHAYHITNSKERESLVKLHATKQVSTIIQASTHFPKVHDNIDGERYECAVQSGEMLLEVLRNKLTCEKPPTSMCILWNAQTPLAELMRRLWFEANYRPKATVSKYHGTIDSITIKINDTDVCIRAMKLGTNVRQDSELTNMTFEEYEHYSQVRQRAFAKLMHDDLKSEYAPSLMQLMCNYKRGALNVKFVDTKEAKGHGLDLIKHYPYCATLPTHLPVYNCFNEVWQYDGHAIEPYTQYFIKALRESKTPAEIVLMSQKRDRVFGVTLMEMNKLGMAYEVLAYARPHRLPPNPYEEVVHAVLNDTEVSELTRKAILCESIGMLGKTRNNKRLSYFYDTFEDAERMRRECDVGDVEQIVLLKQMLDDVHYEAVQSIYAYNQYDEKELIDGFLPIHRLIYDMSRIEVAKLIGKVERQGCQVVAVHCDCVIVRKKDGNKLKYPAKTEIDGCDPKNIGKVKYEAAFMPSKHYKGFSSFAEHVPKTIIAQKPEPTPHLLKDEFDRDEIVAKANELGNFVMFKAYYAGSGKSTACFAAVKDMSALVVCPQNRQAREVRQKMTTVNASTLHKLCCMRLNDDGSITRSRMKEIDYEAVVFEEVGQYTVSMWLMVKGYISRHPDTKFFANGDFNQLPPIENDHCVNKLDSDCRIVIANTLFPNQILLTVPKRCPVELRGKWIELFDDIFKRGIALRDIINKWTQPISIDSIPTDAVCISYKHDTRELVNERIHTIRNPGKPTYFKGMNVIAVKRIASGEKVIHVNYEYRIESLTAQEVSLVESGGDDSVIHTLLIETLNTHFTLPYAFTNHSLQGSTIDAPVVLFDTAFHRVDHLWLYTALTRNRDMKNYRCDVQSKDAIPEADANRAIVGYMLQDGRANRAFNEADYIDVPWILKQSIKQKHVCVRCNDVMRYGNVPGDPRNWTVDRKDNAVAHTRKNCCLMCHNCNVSKH